MIGHNFRLGEIECAIGIEQLKKLPGFVESRQLAAARLSEGLEGLPGLWTPLVKPGCTHSYYMYFMVLDDAVLGTSRDSVFEALVAEGMPGLSTKFENLHLLPMYQRKIAYGSKGFPWTSDICQRDVDYSKGICPVAENLHDKSYIGFQMCMFELTDFEIDLIVSVFRKVWSRLDDLR